MLGATPYLFAGTLRDNLLLGAAPPSGAARRIREARPPGAAPEQLDEARQSGNIDLDLHADWVDYRGAGVADAEALSHTHHRGAGAASISMEDVYTFGLRWRIDPAAHPEAAARLLEARRHWPGGSSRTASPTSSRPMIPSASTPTPRSRRTCCSAPRSGPVFDFEALADNSYVLQVLDKVGLTEDLVDAGRQVAATMIELFADLPPDHEFFEQFSFISANDLPEFAAILSAHRRRRRRRRCAKRGPRTSCCRCRSS